MNHKHKGQFVAALLVLGVLCSLSAWRLESRIAFTGLRDWQGQLTVPVRRSRTALIQSTTGHAPAPTPTPNLDTSGPRSRAAELAIKPTSTHASEILKEKTYPQNDYYALDTTPNDPTVNQWPLTIINAPAAWDTTTGTNDMVVAVLDTGFALDHEELTNRWYTNPGESGNTSAGGRCWTGVAANKATNNCDDDNNGYKDDWRGWDFFWSDNNPNTGSATPGGSAVSHGTAVASLIGGTANNSAGSAGLNWQTKILPIQVLSDNGNGVTYDVVAGIEYAINQGAKVINMSLGSTLPDDALLAAVRLAYSRNVVVIAAAGNCGHLPTGSCNNLSEPGNITYPALYDEVIAVGALSEADTRASFSSYGSALDVSAPGANLPYAAGWSATNQTAAYVTNISGTSFAAPITSGLASLLRGLDSSLGPKDIKAILADSTDRVSGMNGQAWTTEYGSGRINALKAVQLTQVRSTAFKAGTVPSNSKRAPILAFSTGTTSGTAVTDSNEVLATCSSYMGDSCLIEFTKVGTTTKVTLPALKTDTAGTAGWRFTPNEIGLTSGSWTARAHGNGLSSVAVVFYVQ